MREIGRQIKFRAWDGEKVMFFDLEHGLDCGFIYKGDESMYIDDEGTVVMQFTGLLDKNGKEIFEGDILHDERVPRWFNWLIEIVDGSVCLINIGVEGYRHEPIVLTKSSASERVIIGNMYENPNLIL